MGNLRIFLKNCQATKGTIFVNKLEKFKKLHRYQPWSKKYSLKLKSQLHGFILIFMDFNIQNYRNFCQPAVKIFENVQCSTYLMLLSSSGDNCEING